MKSSRDNGVGLRNVFFACNSRPVTGLFDIEESLRR